MREEPVARVVLRHYQDWVLPPKVIRVILAVALLCVFLGMILVSVGGGLHNTSLLVAGGVLAGVGGCGLLLCLLLCMHACFVFRVRDQAVQTEAGLWDDEGGGGGAVETNAFHPNTTTNTTTNTHHTLSLPPSALKPSDSTLRRQTTGGGGGGGRGGGGHAGGEAGTAGREPKKSVTYSGEVQCYSPPASPALSSSSALSSVFLSSVGGTLEREERGGGGGGGPGHGYHPHPHPPSHHPLLPPGPWPESQGRSQSLPRDVRLQQLIEELDYDVPVERTPMLAPPPRAVAMASGARRPGPGPAPGPGVLASLPEMAADALDRGSVKGAGPEVAAMPPSSASSSLYPPARNRHGTLEAKSSSSKTSDYDNI